MIGIAAFRQLPLLFFPSRLKIAEVLIGQCQLPGAQAISSAFLQASRPRRLACDTFGTSKKTDLI